MFRRLALAAALGLTATAVPAQEQPNLVIVFDGSGSMWGQIGGETKIDLARRALSQVLSEASPEMRIGLLAYGHRVRGQCSDIETLVPLGPAMQTVPEIIAAANGLTPRGMTPISDAVLAAAQGMGFTEQKATVVLVTDGIETCGGDPCALGRALAAQGVDFRAHVVGFDLSDDEQRQVSCLADETGGLFLAADDADDLAAALATTLSAEPQPLPEPPPPTVIPPREVELVLRDVAGGEVLTGRPFAMMEFHPADEAGAPVTPRLGLNPGPITGTVALVPGDYQLLALRSTSAGRPLRISVPVTIPDGAEPYTLDLVLAARLRVTPFLAAGQSLPTADGNGWARLAIHPIIDGAIDPGVNYAASLNGQDVALPPGDYFLRGTLSETLTREALVQVLPGQTAEVDFDFQAAPVTFDLRDAQGFPMERATFRVFDQSGTEAFASGYTRDANGLLPVFLPPGTWRVTLDTRPAAEVLVLVDQPGVPMTLRVGPGDVPDPMLAEGAASQCASIHAAHGCVVTAIRPSDVVAHLGQAGGAALLPRFTGTWQTQDGMMLLVQDGRRVWGEVFVNGGIGTVWGQVGPDGLTLRGAMDRSSNPRGGVEMRLSSDGNSISGVWDHNLGRMGSTISARRLSGAVPPLAVATGTDTDLRLQMSGAPWPPADSAEFAAFMSPALAPADPNTGEDIDAMQAAAPPLGLTGVWATNHQLVTLVQEDRILRGSRAQGTLFGLISADGRTARGVWDNGGQWGLFEFHLDEARMAFDGAWGMSDDIRLAGGSWAGTRRGFLAEVAQSAAHPALADPALADWFAPLRAVDLAPAPEATIAAPGLDFAALQGAYARAGADDALACRETPAYLHPDGELVVWGQDWQVGRPLARFLCSADGACSITEAVGLPDPAPREVRLQLAAGQLQFCADGTCDVALQSCGRHLAAAEVSHLASREGAPAPLSATGLDFASMAGLWTPASGEDPAYACRDRGVFVHPDGTLVVWQNPGPGPEHRMTLLCATSGACVVTGGPVPPPADVEIGVAMTDAGQPALCENGNCSTALVSCQDAALPPSLLERMSAIPPG